MRNALLTLAALAFVTAIWLASGTHGSATTPSPPLVDGPSLPPAGQAFAPDKIVARFSPNASAAAVGALNASLGASVVKDYPRTRMQLLQLPGGANVDAVVAAYRRSPLVLEAGRSRLATILDAPNDTNYSYQWDMHDTASGIRVEPAWAASVNKGAGVVVAVIDTGVAYESFSRPASPGLPAMNFAPAPDLAGVPFVAPKNYVHDDTHANDDHGHGSHVTGTIVQATNNNYGVVGVAYRATIMPIKVLDYSGSGQDADLIDALYYAVDNGADVISMSLGFTGSGAPDANGNYCTEIVGLPAALDYAYNSGVVVVAAAGNDGAATVSCPGAYPTVISVGATRYDAQVTSYSNHGAPLDVAAPGGDPNVDQNADGFSDGVLQETYCYPGSYIILLGIINGTAEFNSFCDVFMSGTSMATPHVSGIAALLLGDSPGLSPAAVQAIIQNTARDYGAPGWDEYYGWGLVDAAAAVAALGGAPTPTPTATLTATATFTATPTSTVVPTATPTPTATPVADSVAVTKASYNSHRDELSVEATSSAAPAATLTAYDYSDPNNPVLLGTLSYNSKKKVYASSFGGVTTKPLQVLVVSSQGGSAVSAVSGR